MSESRARGACQYRAWRRRACYPVCLMCQSTAGTCHPRLSVLMVGRVKSPSFGANDWNSMVRAVVAVLSFPTGLALQTALEISHLDPRAAVRCGSIDVVQDTRGRFASDGEGP